MTTGCSLYNVFFPKILKYSGLWPFSVFPRCQCQCVYTQQAGRTPALQQNWQSSEKSQGKNTIFDKHPVPDISIYPVGVQDTVSPVLPDLLLQQLTLLVCQQQLLLQLLSRLFQLFLLLDDDVVVGNGIRCPPTIRYTNEKVYVHLI